MKEYKYESVATEGGGYVIAHLLNDGWTIDRVTVVDRSIHYVLSRAKSAPEDGTPAGSTSTDEPSIPTPIEDVDQAPINLDDIPF